MLQCPFCGETKDLIVGEDSGECNVCQACGPISVQVEGKTLTMEEAWNIRVTSASVALRCPEVHALVSALIEIDQDHNRLSPVWDLMALVKLANQLVDAAMKEEGMVMKEEGVDRKEEKEQQS